MWTFWLLNVVVAFKTTGFDWKMKTVPKFDVWKWHPVVELQTNELTLQAPLIIEESHVQRVILPYHLSEWKTHLHPHSSHFLLKWSVASPSATPYSMVATQGFLNLQRVFRNIQNMLRDEFGSPSWWAQLFSIEMFLFPTPISSPPAKKVWKKREDQALFPLGTKQNLIFWFRNSAYDSWYPKQPFFSWMFGDFQPLSMWWFGSSSHYKQPIYKHHPIETTIYKL